MFQQAKARSVLLYFSPSRDKSLSLPHWWVPNGKPCFLKAARARVSPALLSTWPALEGWHLTDGFQPGHCFGNGTGNLPSHANTPTAATALEPCLFWALLGTSEVPAPAARQSSRTADVTNAGDGQWPVQGSTRTTAHRRAAPAHHITPPRSHNITHLFPAAKRCRSHSWAHTALAVPG